MSRLFNPNGHPIGNGKEMERKFREELASLVEREKCLRRIIAILVKKAGGVIVLDKLELVTMQPNLNPVINLKRNDDEIQITTTPAPCPSPISKSTSTG